MKDIKICTICKGEFNRNSRESHKQWEEKKTCGVKCRTIFRYGLPSNCVVCEKEFRPQRRDIKCCSLKCSKQNRTTKTKSKVCVVCTKTFYRRLGGGIKIWEKRKICSISCRTIWHKENQIGFQKGHSGYKNSGNFKKGLIPWNKGEKGRRSWHNISGLTHGQNKGKKASEETRAKIRKARALQTNISSGKNHWNWKGGISPLRKQIQVLRIYREWRSDVYERDNYICQHCGVRGGRLNADHIKPFAKIISENKITTVLQAKQCTELWNLSNGKTLCVSCHYKTDTYGSKSINYKC